MSGEQLSAHYFQCPEHLPIEQLKLVGPSCRNEMERDSQIGGTFSTLFGTVHRIEIQNRVNWCIIGIFAGQSM
jgi:hypothetical protein